MDSLDHVITQFEQKELFQIAQELSMGAPEDTPSYILAQEIRKHILENGSAESSKLIDEFIDIAKLIEDTEIHLESFSIPSCYGYVNDQDRSCDYCLLYLSCGQKLINEVLPECYGQLYEAQVCAECMVKELCNVSIVVAQSLPDSYEVYLFTSEKFLTNIMRFLARYRACRYNWPEVILKHKLARFWALKIRNAQVKDIQDPIMRGFALYFGGTVAEKTIEREPVIFYEERNPISKPNVYPIRLTWQFR